jgi:hypothetical protein
MKKITLSILLMAICMPLFANNNSETTSTIVTSSGISLGTAIAVVASWSKNKSILWAVVHGFLSWFYVIYFALTRKD